MLCEDKATIYTITRCYFAKDNVVTFTTWDIVCMKHGHQLHHIQTNI